MSSKEASSKPLGSKEHRVGELLGRDITHFTSDQHFWHDNILSYCKRPFWDIEEMHRTIVNKYNAAVPPGGLVLWVGDAFFYRRTLDAAELMMSLNGGKILIRGNHDKGTRAWYQRVGFEEVYDRVDVFIGGFIVSAQHRPTDFNAGRDTVLHGHTHSPQRSSSSGVHVGVDAWDFCPAPMSEVEKLVVDVACSEGALGA